MQANEDRCHESPSQTAGPYLHIGLTPSLAGLAGVYAQNLGAVMLAPDTPGMRIAIEGTIVDGDGAPLRDALVEIWQADAEGRHAASDGSSSFTGWGRQATDLATGLFRFETVKPGAVRCADGSLQAPHVALWIVARGINLGLHTRMYFPEDAAAQAVDPVLSRIEPRERVRTLVARAEGGGRYRFDIRLQGDDETVFFDP
ncbi:MAG: protocatechuate 3,4-dioxygenase subunit alpha [Gammaproteobacteria bacterium]